MVKLVNAENLLIELWAEGSRPTLRTIRAWQKARRIPYIQLGRKIYFDPDEVRGDLEKRWTVRAK